MAQLFLSFSPFSPASFFTESHPFCCLKMFQFSSRNQKKLPTILGLFYPPGNEPISHLKGKEEKMNSKVSSGKGHGTVPRCLAILRVCDFFGMVIFTLPENQRLKT